MPRAVTLLPIASGVLYGLSLPPFNFHVLAWICLVPLLFVPPKNIQTALWWGLVSGFFAHLLIYSWIWGTFKAAGIPFLTAFFSWVFLALLLSVYLGGFMVLLFKLPDHWSKPWLSGCAWVCLEHLKSNLFTGLPWALLSHSQANNLPLIQIASLTGAPGISFLLVTGNVTFANILKGRDHLQPLKFLVKGKNLFFFSFLILVYFWGWRQLNNPVKGAHDLKVAILQGNIDQYKKWDSKYEEDIRTVYEGLAIKAATRWPDMIVWPESAVPGWYPNDKEYVSWIKKIATDTKTHHVLGAISTRRGKDFNSVFLVGPDGRIKGQYDKMHLVPFGEYIPFGGFMKNLIPYLGTLGLFSAGEKQALFEVSGTFLSPSICYESIFSEPIRKSVVLGASLLVNITNDGWYLKTGAPEQHFNANIFRAVENARPLVRAANTGISGVIDERGRQLLRTPLMERGDYHFTVSVPEMSQHTLFVRLGPWFTYLCWLVLGGSFLVRKIRK